MFDAHLHGPIAALGSLPDRFSGMVASSGPDDWNHCITEPMPRGFIPMFGLLPQEYYTYDLPTVLQSIIPAMHRLLQEHPGSGIGEIGLDARFTRSTPMEMQKTICLELIDLARQHKVPVAFHAAACDGTMVALIRQNHPDVPMIWHGFLGSPETAKILHDLGCIVSIGPSVWRPKTKLQQKLRQLEVPFFLETDYPWHYRLPGEDLLSYPETLVRNYERCAIALSLTIEQLETQCDGIAKVFTNFTTHR